MILHQLTCCATNEIEGLRDHRTPQSAMLSFCKNLKTYSGTGLDTLGAFYFFTAVVKDKSLATERLSKYGEAFAAYIKTNKLGTIVEGPARVNRVNVPEHTVKVWIWCPSEKAMNAWWAQNKPKNMRASYRW